MKKLNLTMLAGMWLAGGLAHADYQCTDYGNEISMTVKENHITDLGDTSVSLASATENTQFFGKIHSQGGDLLKKKVVDLYPFQGDTLIILSKPMSCGRGSCDFDDRTVIRAHLKVGETQTHFYCNEINP